MNQLMTKVSRERIGKEIEKIFSLNCPEGLKTLIRYKVDKIIVSPEISEFEYLKTDIINWNETFNQIDIFFESIEFEALLALFLLPHWSNPNILIIILKKSLKLSNEITNDIYKLTYKYEKIIDLVFKRNYDMYPIEIGDLISSIGHRWRDSFRLAAIKYNQCYYQQKTWITKKYLNIVFETIQNLNLAKAYEFDGILSGEEIQIATGKYKEDLGKFKQELIRKQFTNPNISRNELFKWCQKFQLANKNCI